VLILSSCRQLRPTSSQFLPHVLPVDPTSLQVPVYFHSAIQAGGSTAAHAIKIISAMQSCTCVCD